MPMDMSDALLDPLMQDTFSVIRRQETITQQGRGQINTQTFQSVIGVVVPATPDQLERMPDYDYQQEAISIVTKFKLRSDSQPNNPGAKSYKGDIINWNGTHWLVKVFNDFGRYGTGFVEAICVSFDYIEPPPPEGYRRMSLDFSNPSNSGLVGCF